MTNQRLRLLTLALLVGTLMLDIGVVELHLFAPATTQASDANFINNPAGNGAVLMRVADARTEDCQMIFIGASNVEFWGTEGLPVWNKYYAPRHALNFGVAGDRTEDVLWRLDHVNLSFVHPKVAVIFLGLNNITNTPRDTATGLRAVMKKAQSLFPGVKTLLVSLTPNQRDDKVVVETNKILRDYADNQTIFYIDLYSQLPREANGWKGLRSDQLHLTAEGYQTWADVMEPVLQTLLPEKTDPLAKAASSDGSHDPQEDPLPK